MHSCFSSQTYERLVCHMGRGRTDWTVAIIFEKYICINMILIETLGITHLPTKIVKKKDYPDLQVWFNNRKVENLSQN